MYQNLSNVFRSVLVLAVIALSSADMPARGEGVTQRPIEDFVDAQGTFCWPEGYPAS